MSRIMRSKGFDRLAVDVLRLAREVRGSPSALARALGVHQTTASQYLRALRGWGYDIPLVRAGRPRKSNNKTQ